MLIRTAHGPDPQQRRTPDCACQLVCLRRTPRPSLGALPPGLADLSTDAMEDPKSLGLPACPRLDGWAPRLRRRSAADPRSWLGTSLNSSLQWRVDSRLPGVSKKRFGFASRNHAGFRGAKECIAQQMPLGPGALIEQTPSGTSRSLTSAWTMGAQLRRCADRAADSVRQPSGKRRINFRLISW